MKCPDSDLADLADISDREASDFGEEEEEENYSGEENSPVEKPSVSEIPAESRKEKAAVKFRQVQDTSRFNIRKQNLDEITIRDLGK